MKVLLIYDDFWHPNDVIDRGLATFPERIRDYEFDKVISAKDILTPEFVSEFPVIVIAKGDAINGSNSNPWFEAGVTDFSPADFRAYVENGGGLVSLHAGNVFDPETCPEMVELIGNHFVTHPPRCKVRVYPVSEHPIADGVNAFEVRDEHYEIMTDESIGQVFLQSSSETGGVQTAGYVKEVGNGRICVLTPGHTLACFADPNFQTLFMNAIDWCAKKI